MYYIVSEIKYLELKEVPHMKEILGEDPTHHVTLVSHHSEDLGLV
jgi:hypothetical protein